MLGKLFRRKVVEHIVYTALVLVIIISIFAIYWTVEDAHMLTVHNAKYSNSFDNGTLFGDIPIRPQQVRAGDFVFMHIDYCKLRDIDGKVVVRLVGSKFITRLTWPDDRTKTGCVNTEIPIPIPDNSNDDVYYIEFEVIYQVNPLKNRDVILRSTIFKVDNSV
jgi:hypothetical protein